MKISIWHHVLLLTAFQFGGAFAVAYLVLWLCGNVPNGLIRFALAALSLMAGWVTAGELFNWAFVARCPRCGGSTIREEAESIQYRCQVCKHVAKTIVRSD